MENNYKGTERVQNIPRATETSEEAPAVTANPPHITLSRDLMLAKLPARKVMEMRRHRLFPQDKTV